MISVNKLLYCNDSDVTVVDFADIKTSLNNYRLDVDLKFYFKVEYHAKENLSNKF